MRAKVKRDAENFRLRTGKDWVDSQTITNCAECDEKFTVLNRKHHCRQCGLVICKKCSPERVIINNIRVRICQSCSDDVSVRGFPSVSVSSNDFLMLCIVCRQCPSEKLGSLIEGRIGGQELIYWHPSCLKCEQCSNILKLNEAYIYPPFGNTEGLQSHFYCEEHVPKTEIISDTTPLNLPPPPTEKNQQNQNQQQQQKQSNSSDSNVINHQLMKKLSMKNSMFEPLHFTYGQSPRTQYYLLHVPQENVDKIQSNNSDRRSVPLVVLLHGGFWKSKYSISNSCLDNLPKFFMSLGIAVCVIEYRRVKAEHDIDEGGWPETGDDILNALNHLYNECSRLNLEIIQESQIFLQKKETLTRRAIIDTNRIVLLGHSAGGQLALWTCCEPQLSKLPFKPLMCVGIAPVANMIDAYRLRFVNYHYLFILSNL